MVTARHEVSAGSKMRRVPTRMSMSFRNRLHPDPYVAGEKVSPSTFQSWKLMVHSVLWLIDVTSAHFCCPGKPVLALNAAGISCGLTPQRLGKCTNS